MRYNRVIVVGVARLGHLVVPAYRAAGLPLLDEVVIHWVYLEQRGGVIKKPHKLHDILLLQWLITLQIPYLLHAFVIKRLQLWLFNIFSNSSTTSKRCHDLIGVIPASLPRPDPLRFPGVLCPHITLALFPTPDFYLRLISVLDGVYPVCPFPHVSQAFRSAC
jgi:hypothetical protein